MMTPIKLNKVLQIFKEKYLRKPVESAMLDLFKEKLRTIDARIAMTHASDIPHLLSVIPLDVFGKLLLKIPRELPNMREFFPSMASDEVQNNWTGATGDVLLSQSLAFIKTLMCGYREITGNNIEKNTRILDYGCGWGRLTRLLYKFTSIENIYAVDPWEESIKQCKIHGIKGNLALIDWTPETLPFECRFDIIFAFSVFTHLSEKTMHVVLNTLRNYISEDGLLAITIRPKEYWHIHEGGRLSSEMIRDHEMKRYAFAPPKGSLPSDEITFGDTSIAIDYIVERFPQWELVSVEYNLIDAYQIILFFKTLPMKTPDNASDAV